MALLLKGVVGSGLPSQRDTAQSPEFHAWILKIKVKEED